MVANACGSFSEAQGIVVNVLSAENGKPVSFPCFQERENAFVYSCVV